MSIRSLRDELAFLLDSTVDLPATAYDRETLLERLEEAIVHRSQSLGQRIAELELASRDIACTNVGTTHEDAGS